MIVYFVFDPVEAEVEGLSKGIAFTRKNDAVKYIKNNSKFSYIEVPLYENLEDILMNDITKNIKEKLTSEEYESLKNGKINL